MQRNITVENFTNIGVKVFVILYENCSTNFENTNFENYDIYSNSQQDLEQGKLMAAVILSKIKVQKNVSSYNRNRLKFGTIFKKDLLSTKK